MSLVRVRQQHCSITFGVQLRNSCSLNYQMSQMNWLVGLGIVKNLKIRFDFDSLGRNSIQD